MSTPQGERLAFCRRELANTEAMVKRAVALIEDLMPGIGYTVVDMGELNSWLNDSRRYTGIPSDKVLYETQGMECPGCKEIELRRQIGSDEMYECASCGQEVQF